MQETTFTLKASDGKEIFVYKWLPEDTDNIWLVLQIAHGMAEHAARYRDFAQFLTSKGVAVYANDHRGHGKTAKNEKELGFFKEKDGWLFVLEDMNLLTKKINEELPGKKVVLFGHSMGSLLARAYISKYPNALDGVILSGTSGESGPIVGIGKFIASLQGIFSDIHKPSNLLNSMSFKEYNKPFKPAKTEFDWLSRDEQKVKEYVEDPLCGFVTSNRFYYDLLSLVQYINKLSTYQNAPAQMPMLFISGDKDPVGDFGKGVKKVFQKYSDTGHSNISMKLYPGARHELLNEINRQEIYGDIFNWLEENFKA